jgi:hypothetical protein
VEIVAPRHRRETDALRPGLGQDAQLVLVAPEPPTLPAENLRTPHARSFQN